MAGKTAALDRRMNRFLFSLVLVAFEALGRVDICGERSRVLASKKARSTANGKQNGDRHIPDQLDPQRLQLFTSEIADL
jgi:hypothetical protein